MLPPRFADHVPRPSPLFRKRAWRAFQLALDPTTCVGEGKQLAVETLSGLTTGFLQTLERAGAGPEEVDTVMKLGMNHPMGLLALADFIGLDTCLAILEVLHDGLGDPKYRPAPLLRKYVAAGWLGKKSGRGFYEY